MDNQLQDILDFLEEEKASGAKGAVLIIPAHDSADIIAMLKEKGYIQPGEKIDYTGNPLHPRYRRHIAQDLTITFV